MFKIYVDVFCVIYLNNVLIYFKIKNLHLKKIRKMLYTLLKYQLYIKLSKCAFDRNNFF